MLWYFNIALVLIATFSIAKEDVNKKLERKNSVTKRHDGYVMDIGYLVKFLADVQTERKEQKKQIDSVVKLVKDLKNKAASQINVAFYAWLSPNGVSNNEIVKYDRITTNIGNAYNVNSGKFVAPQHPCDVVLSKTYGICLE
ncbi:hypothetical protein KUTeg_022922, partial [Tegillarca granosa]